MFNLCVLKPSTPIKLKLGLLTLLFDSLVVKSQIVVTRGACGRARTTQRTLIARSPFLAEIVISEVIDDDLLGEGVIPMVAHSRRNLAVPGARVISATAKV